MSEVRAQIDIDAPPETVYDRMLDPERLHEWVTIHRKINRTDSGEPREGYEMGSRHCVCATPTSKCTGHSRRHTARTRPRGRAEGPRAPTLAPVTG